MNDYTFGNFICELRTEKGLSQSQLGALVGVSNTAVSKWENGKSIPSMKVLKALAGIFDVQVEELLNGKRRVQEMPSVSRSNDPNPPEQISSSFPPTEQPVFYGYGGFTICPNPPAPSAVFPQLSTKVEVGMILLFLANFAALYSAIWMISNDGWIVNATANMWYFYLFLPIPILSIILGFLCRRKGYKTTKNIVTGFIFAGLFLIYGSFTWIFAPEQTLDFQYVAEISTQIDFTLPTEGRIEAHDWGNTESSPYTQQETRIQLTDDAQIQSFENAIADSEKWTDPSANQLLSVLLPYFVQLSYHTQDFILLYNVDQKTYNTLPTQPGTYSFIYISYLADNHLITIEEYTIDVNLQSEMSTSQMVSV